jgi:hypothetical protein
MSGGDISVAGGAGIETRFDDLLAAARQFTTTSQDIAAIRGRCAQVAGDLTRQGGTVDAAGAGAAEAAVRDLSVPLASIEHDLRAIGRRLGDAAARYRAADVLGGGGNPLLSIFDTVAGALWHLPVAVLTSALTLLKSGNAVLALQSLLTSDPELVDQLINALLVTVAAKPLTALLLDSLLLDGHATVRGAGTDSRPDVRKPPRGVADLMAALGLRSHGRHGEVDVKFLAGADGTRRVIVDIPGTKSWCPTPNGDVTSLVTNVHAVLGVSTSYERGVLEAMRRAGVTRSDEVMLVGHSEGGMVAVQAARDAIRSSEFSVTHVITAGSPIGITAATLPRSVQVLALENATDLVPHLDGRPNPRTSNITTVTIHRGDGTIADSHDIEDSYRPGAADVDRSGAPSVRAFLDGASGFFEATSVRAEQYVITRSY